MKDIYEMFNDIEVDENEFEEMDINEIEKERVKNKVKVNLNKNNFKVKKVSRNKKIAIAAAIALVCVSTTIAIKPALATNIPIIGELFKKKLVSVNKEYNDYVDVIGKTKSCEGIDVTFESVVADSDMIFLNFIVKNNNKEITHDYKEVSLMPRKIKVNDNNVTAIGYPSWEFIDNNTIRVIKRIDWSEFNLPNQMNIDISITELLGKSGDWGVKFSLDKSKAVENTIHKNLDKRLEMNRKEVNISTVTFSPLTVKINGEGQIWNFDNDEYMQFIVLDQNGSGLMYDGGEQNSSNSWSETYIANNDLKNITIIPVHKASSKEEGNKLPAVKLDVNDEKTIDLKIDEDRDIVIKEYFIDGDYLIIKYNEKYFGKEGFKQSCCDDIYVTVDGAIVKRAEDDKGNELFSRYKDFKYYTMVYKVGASRNIQVGTYDGSKIKMLKDKSITVDMNK